MNVGFISLGCSKNLIDTEVAIGKFKSHNFTIVDDARKADIIVINTCGFIASAKEEAINTILEMAELKNNKCKYLIVMGCLVQRYYEDLVKSLPEVDLFIKIENYETLWEQVENMLQNKTKAKREKNKQIGKMENKKVNKLPMFKEEEYLKREVSTGKNYAYLKIGEGCSNFCTYCAIPYIRGLFVSRPMEEIIEEAQGLAKKGIKELIIIAQDTTKYGVDLYDTPKLPELLNKISRIDGIKWIRFLYSYPEGINDELIKEVKENPKICKYFDIPIQHISDDVLKRMNRKTSKDDIISLINKIRREIPNIIIRTTLMVGFPGETEDNFNELYDFVKKTKFDKLGVFKYSKEENTIAEKMKNQIHYKTKEARRNKIMLLQQEISRNILEKMINKTIEVLIENISFDGKYYIGRTSGDVPEEDGLVYIEKKINDKTLINKFVKCKITSVCEYDLIAKII